MEITLLASNTYANPYTDVQVWVDLSGPGFARRCYGFWDGGNTFRVRVLAITPGHWRWRSASHPEEPGLTGRSGAFEAVPWTDAEGVVVLPPFPETRGQSDTDWALKLASPERTSSTPKPQTVGVAAVLLK